MLEKGTITKKGKLRSKKRRTEILSDAERDALEARRAGTLNKTKEDADKKRANLDFVGDANLGDLDMDQFLSSVVQADLDNAGSNSNSKSKSKNNNKNNNKNTDGPV